MRSGLTGYLRAQLYLMTMKRAQQQTIRKVYSAQSVRGACGSLMGSASFIFCLRIQSRTAQRLLTHEFELRFRVLINKNQCAHKVWISTFLRVYDYFFSACSILNGFHTLISYSLCVFHTCIISYKGPWLRKQAQVNQRICSSYFTSNMKY